MSTAQDTQAQMTIVINDLSRKPSNPSWDTGRGGDSSEKFVLKASDTVLTLWNEIEGRGYVAPELLVCKGHQGWWTKYSRARRPSPFEEVEIVGPDEPSNYNAKKINVNETLIAFANRSTRKELTFDIEEEFDQDAKVSLYRLSDGSGLKIDFHRTIRMPDDNKLHQLPASLGLFPLYNVEAFASRLSEKVTSKGGVFLPMWQREALWLGFSSLEKYALRVFVGHINAVSGLEMDLRNDSGGDTDEVQDYIILPDQQWLDGICVGPGVVRQFVAMPLGAGYTIESQRTGEEKFGGIQIELIPAFKQGLKTWTKSGIGEDSAESVIAAPKLSEGKTPFELRLEPTTKIRAYPPNVTYMEPSRIADIIKSSAPGEALRAQYPNWRIMEKGNVSYDPRGSQKFYGERDAPMVTLSSQGNISTEHLPAKPDLPSTQDLAAIDLKEMGIAAGGKLIQDIIRDNNPSLIWNHEGSRIINVHILEPTSCEAITHMVPPPPPQDVKAYADAGLPFFVLKEDTENRLEGGEFSNVVSVSEMDKTVGVTTEPEFDPSKPKMCTGCTKRLCDCIIWPCNHQFCNVCVSKLDAGNDDSGKNGRKEWKCPICGSSVARVAGFSAPMNLPGEEALKLRVPVRMLRVEDGRVRFESIYKSRI